MKVLMLATDRRIFERNAQVRERMREYGRLFDELSIVVYTPRGVEPRKVELEGNVVAYPTNTRWKPWYLIDAYQLGKRLLEGGAGGWVITSQDPFETGLVGCLLSRRFKVPLQVQVHTDLFSPYFRRESCKNWLRMLLARKVLSAARGIRVVSRRIKQSIEHELPRFPSERIGILPIAWGEEGEAEERGGLQRGEERLVILMASRLASEKNIALGIRAIDELRERFPNVLLNIVGEGPELERLELAVRRLRLEGNAAFEPWAEDLSPHYRAADIFLLTSNYEGYGRTVVEAMRAGLPVVMTDVGVAHELVENEVNGYIVPVADVAGVVAALEKLLRDRNLRKEIGERNERAVKDKTLSKARYLDVFRSLLASL
jgi:glycosyltransferase involved in cell wall biosynthesis